MCNEAQVGRPNPHLSSVESMDNDKTRENSRSSLLSSHRAKLKKKKMGLTGGFENVCLASFFLK